MTWHDMRCLKDQCLPWIEFLSTALSLTGSIDHVITVVSGQVYDRLITSAKLQAHVYTWIRHFYLSSYNLSRPIGLLIGFPNPYASFFGGGAGFRAATGVSMPRNFRMMSNFTFTFTSLVIITLVSWTEQIEILTCGPTLCNVSELLVQTEALHPVFQISIVLPSLSTRRQLIVKQFPPESCI